MSFRILVFYQTDEALDRYLSQFKIGACDLDAYLLKKTKDDRLYAAFHIEILCKRGLNESHRGYRAHFVAVQEELTWGMVHLICYMVPEQLHLPEPCTNLEIRGHGFRF